MAEDRVVFFCHCFPFLNGFEETLLGQARYCFGNRPVGRLGQRVRLLNQFRNLSLRIPPIAQLKHQNRTVVQIMHTVHLRLINDIPVFSRTDVQAGSCFVRKASGDAGGIPSQDSS